MSRIGGGLARRIVQVAGGTHTSEELLTSVGLSPNVDGLDAAREMVEAEAFYGLIELATDPTDHGLPFRYATALRLEDVGALGLALKTAHDLREALHRLARYILVLSDTLDYELIEHEAGADLVMTRPRHRRGAQLANECALAAVVSVLRQVAGSSVAPIEVTFRHAPPQSTAEHWAYFGCPVRFDAASNAVRLDEATLRTRGLLGDEGLSRYLLAQLDELHEAESEPSLGARVHGLVTDSLPDGLAPKAEIARRLGMSERTLHRRLTEEGESFRSITKRARREAAESLLAEGRHALVDIAFLTGFSDQSAFQRAFKTWTGHTPLEFRNSAAVRHRTATGPQKKEE